MGNGRDRRRKKKKAGASSRTPNRIIYIFKYNTNYGFVKKHFEIFRNLEMAAGATRQKNPRMLQGLSFQSIPRYILAGEAAGIFLFCGTGSLPSAAPVSAMN